MPVRNIKTARWYDGGATDIALPGIGNVYYVNGGSDGPATDGGDGLTPATCKKTLTAALALCTTDNEDYVIVLNYGAAGRAAEAAFPIDIAKNRVHIIGVGTEGHKWACLQPAGDTAFFTVSGMRVEIANLELGGGAAHAAIETLSGIYPWGLTIHDCWFGRADCTGRDGIGVLTGSDAPYLTVYGCWFGGALTRDGIRIAGNATRGSIGLPGRAKNFFAVTAVGINVTGAAAEVGCFDNVIECPADTKGIAISYSAGSSAGYCDGNRANYGKTAMAQIPYLDLGANGWGVNYHALTVALPAVA